MEAEPASVKCRRDTARNAGGSESARPAIENTPEVASGGWVLVRSRYCRGRCARCHGRVRAVVRRGGLSHLSRRRYSLTSRLSSVTRRRRHAAVAPAGATKPCRHTCSFSASARRRQPIAGLLSAAAWCAGTSTVSPARKVPTSATAGFTVTAYSRQVSTTRSIHVCRGGAGDLWPRCSSRSRHAVRRYAQGRRSKRIDSRRMNARSSVVVCDTGNVRSGTPFDSPMIEVCSSSSVGCGRWGGGFTGTIEFGGRMI